eukprot:5278227-Amphidinium_carterae.1
MGAGRDEGSEICRDGRSHSATVSNSSTMPPCGSIVCNEAHLVLLSSWPLQFEQSLTHFANEVALSSPFFKSDS